jgi:uncharacterized protein (DUF169 family)
MEYQAEDYRNVGKKLKEMLELETDLVAIKYIKDVSEIPDGFIRPLADTGKKMTLCMAISDARWEGMKHALTGDDNPCVINIPHGWSKVSLLNILRSQTINQWQKNLLSVIRANNQRWRLGGLTAQWPFSTIFLGHIGFLASPLSGTPFIPDTVLAFGYPEQILHVCHSLSFEGKHVPRAVMVGFGDSCWAAGLMPMKSKNPVFVLLGTGERVLAHVENYEVAIGMPGSMVFYLDKYLFKAGGEHNVPYHFQNPPKQVDEDWLPGWRFVRDRTKH